VQLSAAPSRSARLRAPARSGVLWRKARQVDRGGMAATVTVIVRPPSRNAGEARRRRDDDDATATDQTCPKQHRRMLMRLLPGRNVSRRRVDHEHRVQALVAVSDHLPASRYQPPGDSRERMTAPDLPVEGPRPRLGAIGIRPPARPSRPQGGPQTRPGLLVIAMGAMSNELQFDGVLRDPRKSPAVAAMDPSRAP